MLRCAFCLLFRYTLLNCIGQTGKKTPVILTDRSGSGRCWVAIMATAQASRRKQSQTSTWAAVSPGGSTPRPYWPALSCWSAPSAVGPTSATPWRIPGSHVNAHRQVHSACSQLRYRQQTLKPKIQDFHISLMGDFRKSADKMIVFHCCIIQ